ncbi:MAG: sigma-70 family RNA polymerase sigma factor [Acidobacteria bacterium]|nr:MAG: sigma-70 family RNA polymerase sigma factor [Acidobacteriota bacterium]
MTTLVPIGRFALSESERRSATLSARNSDAELVERHRQGDASAFLEIVDTYSSLLYNIAFRMTGNREDALDLHQEVLLKIYRSLDRFRGQASLRTWMYRITVNAARNRARWWSRVKRGTTYSLDAAEENRQPPSERVADPRPDPEGRAYGAEIRVRVQQGLDQLPVGQRVAVILRDIEGLEYREIAATLGISLGTVKSRLARGREALRRQLADLLE